MKRKKINLELPRQWDQLTPKQLLRVCKLLASPIDETKKRTYMFVYLTGIKPVCQLRKRSNLYIYKKGRVRFSFTPQELHYHLSKLDFLFQNCQLTRNKFPKIRVGLRKLFGPTTKCYNITFAEFIHAERFNFEFSQTQSADALNKLCAILYRPKARRPSSDDVRQPFNDYAYTRRARRFARVSPHLKLAIYLFYSASMGSMVKKFPNLFSGSRVSSEAQNPVPALNETIKAIANYDVTKDETVLNMQVWRAFDYLDTMIKNSKPPKK